VFSAVGPELDRHIAGTQPAPCAPAQKSIREIQVRGPWSSFNSRSCSIPWSLVESHANTENAKCSPLPLELERASISKSQFFVFSSCLVWVYARWSTFPTRDQLRDARNDDRPLVYCAPLHCPLTMAITSRGTKYTASNARRPLLSGKPFVRTSIMGPGCLARGC